MLQAIVFLPSAPLLLPDLGGGPADLRSACMQAISLLDGCDEMIVIGAATPPGWRTGTVDATGFGVLGSPVVDQLPLPLAVGSALLVDRPHRLLAVDGSGLVLAGCTGLLVVADGSATRTEKAPGYFHPEAEVFDAAVAEALRAGDPAALLACASSSVGDEVMAGGCPAWRSAARVAAGGPWSGSLLYDQAPYGVGYLVATWTRT